MQLMDSFNEARSVPFFIHSEGSTLGSLRRKRAITLDMTELL